MESPDYQDFAAPEVVCVRELFEYNNLIIPSYQRPYSWKPKNAIELLDDIRVALDSGQREYPLGAVVLYQAKDIFQHEVVDGQQRLITLEIIRDLLSTQQNISFSSASEDIEQLPPIVKVHQALRKEIKKISPESREAILHQLNEKCVFVVVLTHDRDEAFRFFDSQNYRGKPLQVHDLLKSYHLREMTNVSDSSKIALIEAWESAQSDDLEKLFAVYLFRIHQWIRGNDALRFTVEEIDTFKGISVSQANTPASIYHVAAHQFLPALAPWLAHQNSGSLTNNSQNSQHTVFQLDQPLIAGEYFFKLVEFFLVEVTRLKKNFDEISWIEKSERERYSKEARYQKLKDLYLTVSLYYINRFGEHRDFEEAEKFLFAWAFLPRLYYQNMGIESINNYAKEGGTQGREISPFALFHLIREEQNPNNILRLYLDLPEEPRSEKDNALRSLLFKLLGKGK